MRRVPPLNLSAKLGLFVFAISVCPLLVVGLLSYNVARQVSEGQATQYTQALLAQQTDYVDLILRQIESLIGSVSGVDAIKSALDESFNPNDDYRRLATQAEIGYILNRFVDLEGLVGIDIFGTNGARYHVGDTLDSEDVNQPVLDALWDLVWAGEVTNDSFTPLRAHVAGGSKRSAPRRSRSRGVRSVSAAPPSAVGRWSLVRDLVAVPQPATAVAHAQTLQLLERYGVLTREAALASIQIEARTPASTDDRWSRPLLIAAEILVAAILLFVLWRAARRSTHNPRAGV